jgi:hypothetical protein
MGRAEQFARYADREEAQLWKDYHAGIITRDEYNTAMMEIQREGRAAMDEDTYEAQRAVQDDWGW